MLKIKGLRKSFGSVIAADDIDLSVAQGEALGIIGPNGAGKSVGASEQMQPLENFRAGCGGSALSQTPAMHRGNQQILEHCEILERPRDLI